MRRIISCLLFFILAGSPAYASEAEIATAPDVPPPITRTLPETLVVKFEAREFTGPLAEGKQYKFWSYNGTVPGPMIRVRLGDTVEFHLSNHADSQFPHNIDIHAVNGPGGGAAVSLVAPGEEKIFRFKTLHPGLFIYHCASPIPGIPAHIANGMYGLILVEPKHGFPRVDHEFYVFQSEFYTRNPDPSFVFNVSETSGDIVSEEVLSESKIAKKAEEKIEAVAKKETASSEADDAKNESIRFLEEEQIAKVEAASREAGHVRYGGFESILLSEEEQAAKEEAMDASFDETVDAIWEDKNVILELSLEKGQREQPDYVVFNGRQGALLGQNALQVKVGEKVRIFFGNIGPNGISSFHIIGEIFDRVYLEGAVNGIVNKNVQTTLVPSAGTTIVEFSIDVPGDYLLVDHSIFRMDKGAIGLISAIGDDNPEIFESIK